MINTMAIVKSVLDAHKNDADCKPGCQHADCPEYRIANDWLRQHQDLIRAWKNRTGKEIFLVRKFACAICSEKDTGLICAECIADAQRGDSHAQEEISVLEDMANG
jgi:hypothetical protein